MVISDIAYKPQHWAGLMMYVISNIAPFVSSRFLLFCSDVALSDIWRPRGKHVEACWIGVYMFSPGAPSFSPTCSLKTMLQRVLLL